MVFGAEIYALLPEVVLQLLHLVAAVIGLYVGKTALDRNNSIGYLFFLYAGAELAFLLAHLNVFALQFSHLLAEILLLVGVLWVWSNLKK